jgi:hypothetical protein
MALTAAERKQRYILKHKALNGDEYKLKEKMKNKKYYASNVKHIELKEDDLVIKAPEPNNEFILLKPIKKRLNPINKSKINVNTISLYIKTMKKLYLAYHNEELTDDTELLSVLSNKKYDTKIIDTQFGFIKDNIYDIIKNNNKNDIRILYSVITRFKYYSKTVKQMYPYILNFQDAYDTERANKVVDNTIATKMELLDFNKTNILDKFNENADLSDNEKLIYVLLTLFPTRRPVDYRKMLIAFNEPPNQSKRSYIDKNNYYYNKTFYFNITKNKKLQKFTVPDELDSIIKSLITTKGDNEYLLSLNKAQLTQIQLSKLIMNTFYKIYKVSISAVEIRRLYATHLKKLAENNLITIREHKDICDMMNHNYEENKKYSY